jgi:ABC-type phosphate transport system substrate-binding protein
MSSTKVPRIAFACAIATGMTAAANASFAQTKDCNDPSLPNPIYVYGSSAVKPLIAALGKSLWSQNITIVYVDKGGSCDGVNAIVNGALVSGTGLYYPGTTDDAGAPAVANCNIPITDGGLGGQPVDMGVSDVWAESCPMTTVDYSKVGDFHGPNQVMAFVVPQKATAYRNISAEAAYFVMGKPASAKVVAPWTDATSIAVRNQKSGTQTMLGRAIHLDASLWLAKDSGSSGGVETALKAANDGANPERFLGILSTGEADRDRSFLKVLAFQDMGKKCAYWPDSSLTTFDKANVRSGDYPVFGPLHLLARVSAQGGSPTNPTVKRIIDYFVGNVDPPEGKTQLIDLEIANYTVPQCAMRVRRTTEMGPLSAFTPDTPCGCYFELKATGSAPATCKTCTTNSDCTGANMVCGYGYCEAK